MKLWISTRPLLNYSAPNRTIPCNTLYLRYYHRILIRCSHLPRRKLRVIYPKPSCKRCILLLHLYLPTHWPRTLLRLLPLQGNMKHWSYSSATSDDNRIRRLCSSLRANVLLRRHCYYQSPLCSPLHRRHLSSMNLRGIFSRQPNPYPVLHLPLSPPFRNHSSNPSTSPIPARNRIKQPPRTKLKRG